MIPGNAKVGIQINKKIEKDITPQEIRNSSTMNKKNAHPAMLALSPEDI